MSTIDYRPVLDGVPYDPVPAGGAVSELALYTEADYGDASPATYGPAVRVSAGVYRFTLTVGAQVGRFWPQVTWSKDGSSLPFNDRLPTPLDLPVRDDMVISPEALAGYLGIPLPLTVDQRFALTDALLDAQADVEGYLGRRIVPELVVERKCWPYPGGWTLEEQPVVELVSEVEEFDGVGVQTGFWTVTYRAGLDTRNDTELRPIRRLLMAQAANQPGATALWRTVGSGATAGVGKRVKSVSAEGQSVSYEFLDPSGGPTGGQANAATVGGPVKWASIDRWRLSGRRVYQRPVPAPWVR